MPKAHFYGRHNLQDQQSGNTWCMAQASIWHPPPGLSHKWKERVAVCGQTHSLLVSTSAKALQKMAPPSERFPVGVSGIGYMMEFSPTFQVAIGSLREVHLQNPHLGLGSIRNHYRSYWRNLVAIGLRKLLIDVLTTSLWGQLLISQLVLLAPLRMQRRTRIDGFS